MGKRYNKCKQEHIKGRIKKWLALRGDEMIVVSVENDLHKNDIPNFILSQIKEHFNEWVGDDKKWIEIEFYDKNLYKESFWCIKHHKNVAKWEFQITIVVCVAEPTRMIGGKGWGGWTGKIPEPSRHILENWRFEEVA